MESLSIIYRQSDICYWNVPITWPTFTIFHCHLPSFHNQHSIQLWALYSFSLLESTLPSSQSAQTTAVTSSCSWAKWCCKCNPEERTKGFQVLANQLPGLPQGLCQYFRLNTGSSHILNKIWTWNLQSKSKLREWKESLSLCIMHSKLLFLKWVSLLSKTKYCIIYL